MGSGGQNANPRRRVLAYVREVRRTMKSIVDVWDVTGTVCVKSDHPRGHDIVKRPAAEYPENMRWAWNRLYAQARTLRDQSEALMDLASTEYHKLGEGDRNV